MSSAYVVLPPNVVAENATAMADHLGNFNFAVRSLFYIVSPNETSFQHVDEVPNYFFRVSFVSFCFVRRVRDDLTTLAKNLIVSAITCCGTACVGH
jgi:hypothetical protein